MASDGFPLLAMRGSLFCLTLCFVAVPASAQNPVLAPTVDTSIVVTGPLHYGSIQVPAGVTVRFVAPVTPTHVPSPPTVVFCDGDAIVHGTLSVAGDVGFVAPFTSAAGWVNTGAGLPGMQCGTLGGAGYWYSPPTGGLHAGTYGSVVPFSLEGGSPGGYLARYGPGCWPGLANDQGGWPGGTLVLLAQGRIEVGGAVTADGYHPGSSSGSGGSILLRGAAGVTVLPNGSVTALSGSYIFQPTPPPITFGAPGYVRLDAYGAAPVIQGTVNPAPTVLALPHLRTQSPPQIGSTWILDVLAPENAPIFLAVSLQPAPGTPTPFGPLGIDLALAAGLALTVAQPSHDPIAGVPLPVPNAPALIGLQLWVQGFVVPQNLPPRLTNTLAAVVN